MTRLTAFGTMLKVRISRDDDDALKKIAVRLGVTVSCFVRDAVRQAAENEGVEIMTGVSRARIVPREKRPPVPDTAPDDLDLHDCDDLLREWGAR